MHSPPRLRSALWAKVEINDDLIKFCLGMLVHKLWQAHKELYLILSGSDVFSSQKCQKGSYGNCIRNCASALRELMKEIINYLFPRYIFV